jgi:hypothetical protein
MRKKTRARGPARWLATAVALWVAALGLVLVGVTAPASAAATCPQTNGWTKIDSSSGSPSGEWGSASWANGDTAVSYTVNEGWTLQICIKASTETHYSGSIQGYAQGSFDTGDKHAISHVSLKYTETDYDEPEEIPLPEPAVTDPCGAGNAAWVVPDDTDVLDWTLEEDGDLLVEILAADTVFAETGQTSHDFGQAPETNTEECEVLGEQLEIPAEPGVEDPCDTGNARWVVPADTDKLDWTLEDDGDLVVEITVPDTVFTDTDDTTYNFGKAVETNTDACVKGEQETEPDGEQPALEVKGEQAAVPAVVDAGLAGDGSSGAPRSALLALAGGLLLVGLSCFARWRGSWGTATRR